jgi:vacuolar iron transporter family protein
MMSHARLLGMIKTTRISFGGTAGIVTSMALIVGLNAAKAGRAAIVSALLIAAVADNLTDSLSVHMYQESERLEEKEAFIGTLSNFATRFIVCLSFVLIVVLFRAHAAVVGGIVWGMLLLTVLNYILARHRNVGAMSELGKHLALALVIIFVSQGIGHWITAHVT